MADSMTNTNPSSNSSQSRTTGSNQGSGSYSSNNGSPNANSSSLSHGENMQSYPNYLENREGIMWNSGMREEDRDRMERDRLGDSFRHNDKDYESWMKEKMGERDKDEKKRRKHYSRDEEHDGTERDDSFDEILEHKLKEEIKDCKSYIRLARMARQHDSSRSFARGFLEIAGEEYTHAEFIKNVMMEEGIDVDEETSHKMRELKEKAEKLFR